MKTPVSISKISPPHLPPILYRSRLHDLLKKNEDKKLILILGQAAQGKTTLVASHVKTSKIPSAWLNLDQSDSDPVNLYHLIIQSLKHVLKELDLPLQVYSLLSSAVGLICVGEFSRAEEACQKLETHTEKIDYHKELKAMGAMINCVLSLSKGDFEKAHHLSKLLQMGIEKYGFISMAPWIYEITGYLKLVREDLIDAEHIGNRYVSTAQSLKNNFLKGLAFRLLGLIYLHQKDFKKAREAIYNKILEKSNKKGKLRG